VGRKLESGWAFPSTKFTDAPLAAGTRVEAVRRRGKYLLVDLDDTRELIIHLGMTGRLHFRTSSGPAPGPRAADGHLRAAWRVDDGEDLELHDMRRFGRVAVVAARDYHRLPTLAALGPEPLSEDFTAPGLWRALGASRAHTKTKLLSQRVVAGVGNIYADEALWRARINPASRHVTRPGATRLRDALVAVLSEGLDHGGTTLRDCRQLDGSHGGHQTYLACYGRRGEPCDRCGTVLRHRTLDGRGTTWCPTCQRT
jgi:formamidopyrimidine-DNA glycosylase